MSQATNLRSLKSAEIVALYNTAAAKLGMRLVNKFSDKETAIARTRAIMAKIGTEVTAEEVRRTSSFPPPAAPAATEEQVCTPEPTPAPKAEETAVAAGATTDTQASVATGKRLAKVAKRAGKPSTAPGPLDNLPKANRMSFSFKPLSSAKPPKGSPTSLRAMCFHLMSKGCKFQDVVTLIRDFDAGRGKGNANTIDRRAYELVRIMHYTLGYGIAHDETTGDLKLYTKQSAAA